MSFKDVLVVAVLISAAGLAGFAITGSSWVVTDLESNDHIESVDVTNEVGSDVNIVTVELVEPNSNISQVHVVGDGKTLGMTTYPVGSKTVEMEGETVSPKGDYQIRLVDRSGDIMTTVEFTLVEQHPWI